MKDGRSYVYGAEYISILYVEFLHTLHIDVIFEQFLSKMHF